LTYETFSDCIFPAAAFLLMAVVAASQTYNDLAEPQDIVGYSLRNTSIKAALRIPEDDTGVEVMLSLDLADAATASAPAWTNFSISSVTSGSNEWTEHCTGLVKVEVSAPGHISKMGTLRDLRIVDTPTWYKKFASIGLGYGPAFQGLSKIRSSLDQDMAEAKVALRTTSNTIKGGEAIYPLHPASLDALIQLGLIACHGGEVEKATTAFVPVHLNRLYLNSSTTDEEWATGTALGVLKGLRGAYAKLQLCNQAGEIVLDIDSLRCISYSGSKHHSDEAKAFSSPFSKLVWRPDFRTLTNQQSRELFRIPSENVERARLFPEINKTAMAILVDIYQTFVDVKKGPSPCGDAGRFLAWVKRRVEADDSEDTKWMKRISHAERIYLLLGLFQKTGDIADVRIAQLIHQNLDDILHGRSTGVDLITKAGLPEKLSRDCFSITGAYSQLFNVFDLLGHANPSLNILELGAGTGSATRVVMNALACANGIKRYKQYDLTDANPELLPPARSALKDYSDVYFSVLDLEQDPLEQGFGPVYDVVMASQTLHATASISKSLENCAKLLKPGGKLVLVENTQDNDLVFITQGILAEYWQGTGDCRTDSPFLSQSSWNAALLESGFSGAEITLNDYPEPHNITSVLVSTLLGPESSKAKPDGAVVQLLHGEDGHPALLGDLARALENCGISTMISPLKGVLDTVKPNSHAIAFLGREHMFLDGDETQLPIFQHLATQTKSLICLTSTGIVKGRSADGSFIAGLLRTIGTENPACRFVSVDIDAEDFRELDPNLVRCIVDQHLALQKPNEEESEDREFVWQDGCMWVSRFVPDTGLHEYSEMIKCPMTAGSPEMRPLDSQGPVRADFETPGVLSSLYFKPYTELLQPLPAEWIEVKVAAVGLNWKDLGLTSGRFDANNLSSEYAGVVTKTGSDVTRLSVGDLVYGMGRGHFGSFTRVPAAFAQKLEPGTDLVSAATMPLVHMTAVHAFENITQLKEGQKVLIQTATGGLGIAVSN
jgi:SAM-dependent methyltransferase